MKKTFYLTIFLTLWITSCETRNTNVSKTKNEETEMPLPPAPCEERYRPLDVVDKSDTLKIIVEISDCGEWGGHKESIYLQRNNNNEIVARFIMDTVSCDKIVEVNGCGVLDDKERKKVLDVSKVINLEDEKLISIFLQRLIELSLRNEIDSNAGDMFHVINTNKEMYFTYWNSGNCRDTYYEKVRKQIFGIIKK